MVELHTFSHDRSLLADARGTLDGTQSPLGRYGSYHGIGGCLSRLFRPNSQERRHGSEILRQNGYSNGIRGEEPSDRRLGNQHLRPVRRWPSLQGFDHFYGFIGGETDQWAPPLFRDTTPGEMEIPKGKEGHYTLTTRSLMKLLSISTQKNP
jgi:arylsulfatase A-like enzyme